MKLKTVLSTLMPVILLLILVPLISITALAHVPLIAGENVDISSALHISDPAKSWAVYGVLEKGEAHYFSFDINEGERIYLGLIKSAALEDNDFYPSLILLGPGIASSSDQSAKQPESAAISLNSTQSEPMQPETNLPDAIVLPESLRDLGALTVHAKEKAAATYEPFGPTSYKELAEINISAPQSGRYYAAVYAASNASSAKGNSTEGSSAEASGAKGEGGDGGHYGLVMGYREEFSFTDRMIAPIQIASVYMWEGQSLAMILIPYLVALIAAALIYWRSGRRSLFSLTGTLAGFLFLATSSLIITQMAFSLSRAPWGPEVYITMAIIGFHALLGVASIRLARGEAGILQRALLAVIGTIALLAGSGMIIGPILAISSSFLPTRRGAVTGNDSLGVERKE